MYRRRSNLITFYSLRTLTKVCNRPPKSSSFSINKLPVSRNCSSSLEILYNFYSTNGSNSENVTSNWQQYQDGYYNGNLGRTEQTSNCVYVQNPHNQFQHNQNPNFATGYVENSPRNEFLAYPDDGNGRLLVGYVDHNPKNGNFGVYDGSNWNYLYQQKGFEHPRSYADDFQQNGYANDYRLGGFDQRFNGVYAGVNNGNFQQRWEWDNYGMNYGNYQHSVVIPGNLQQNWNAGYAGVTPGNLQQSWNAGYYGENPGNLQPNWNAGYSGVTPGNLLQSWNAGYSGENPRNSQQNLNARYSGVTPWNLQESRYAGYSGEKPGKSQQNWNADSSRGSYGNSQHGWGADYSVGIIGNPPLNGKEHHTQNVGMHQGTSHDYYAWNGGTLQFPQSNYNAGNPGMYHGNTGFPINHSNVGEFYQFAGASHQLAADFCQQTSNHCEKGDVGSLEESSMKPNEEPEVVIEELKGKVKEVIMKPNEEPEVVMEELKGKMKPNEEPELVLEELKGTIEELDIFQQERKLKEAVYVLGLLEEQHILVDLQRYLLLFKACGEENALEEGKSIHEHLLRSELRLEIKKHNKILEMYCSCGSLDDAFEVFDKMPSRNLTTWDTMISFLAKNGHGEDAIDLFTQFKETGLRPDGTMFLGIFLACGAVGDIIEGLLHFESMKKDYSIVPSMEHYISLVDMLGTAGSLDEALEFIEKMPLEPSIEVWEVLMNLCRIHGNLELGDLCAERVEYLDPSRLDEQSRAGFLPLQPSGLAKDKEKKKSGQAFPDGRSRIHEYRAGDRSHPHLNELLRGMKQQLKEFGYTPIFQSVLHDIDTEAKEEALMGHSERLAVAQGLMTTPARYPIRIIKNVRICVDCHNMMKLVSKLVGRELIIRDAKRFHHFKDGLCSCREYW